MVTHELFRGEDKKQTIPKKQPSVAHSATGKHIILQVTKKRLYNCKYRRFNTRRKLFISLKNGEWLNLPKNKKPDRIQNNQQKAQRKLGPAHDSKHNITYQTQSKQYDTWACFTICLGMM